MVFAIDEYDLEGTIGKIPIFMHLEKYDDTDVMGTYFYKSSLKDIKFRGEYKNGEYKFTVEEEYDKTSETFILKKVGNNFQGKWINNKGKTLLVSLKPINVSAHSGVYSSLDKYQDLKYSDTYNYARMCYIDLKRDTVISDQGKSFVWFSEKHCSADFFRLGNGFTKMQLEAVNPILDNIHLDIIMNQLTCSSQWAYSDGAGIDYTTTINYLDNNLLGFEVFASWFCGGAHPDFGGVGYLIDLNNGHKYDVEEVYNLTQETLYKVLDSQYHFKKPTGEDDYCDYTEVEYWYPSSWKVVKGGVEFTPYFYRAARACENSYFIPFSKLEPYKVSSFPYTLK